MKEREYIVGWQPVLALCDALRKNLPVTVVPEVLWVDKAGWSERADQCRILIKHGVQIHQVEGVESLPQDVRSFFSVQKVVCAIKSVPFDVPKEDWLSYRCVLVCDGIQDPQNLGSLCRLACAMGVDALVLPKHKQVPVTAVVRRVAQGAAERLPIVVVNNLVRWIHERQQQGFWVYGTSERGDVSLNKAVFDAPHTILVMGSEGKGMRRLVAESCDTVLNIPTAHDFKSLNVVQAASMFLYEYHKQQGGR